ncbi:lengsin-like [Haliotis cracherodii]|uniref:lengsin-like n=1 Tax=Haliotis cracherodii TaxID=6455 RepID=UPI0039EAE208
MAKAVTSYDYVRFTFPNIHGTSEGRVVPSRHVEHRIEIGVTVGVDALMLGEWLTTVQTNLIDQNKTCIIGIPDLSTLNAVTWDGEDKFKVAEVICEAFWLKDRTPLNVCTRYVAKQQLQRLSDHGYKMLSGFEMEFMLNDENNSPVSTISHMSHRHHSKHSSFLFALENGMHHADVDIENFHAEWNAGLFEAVIKASFGIKAADSAFKFRNGIHEIADKKGYRVDMTSKQPTGEVGQHFNHSVWSVQNGDCVFSDSNHPDGLSDFGRCWLGGLMKHARALTAFWCPTENCYTRLHLPRKPGIIDWDFDNRLSCVSVKTDTENRGVYLENRIPSGKSNPYLTLAATVAAGLDGVLKGLGGPPHLDPKSDTLPAGTALPTSLSEALHALETDADMVNILGKDLVDWFVLLKTQEVNKRKELSN